MTARMPRCPIWLSKDGRAIWRKLGPSLFRQGILREEDLFSFAGFCEAAALFKRATAALHEAELVQTSESGWKAQHPAVTNFNNALSGLLKAGALFGLDPSVRSRLKVDRPDDEKSLADALFAAVNGD